MRKTQRFFGAMLMTLMVMGVFGVVPSVQAATDSCSCYCTSPTGAKQYPDATTKIERTACDTACKASGQNIAAFACTANQHPSRSLNCFTADQCAEHNGVLDGYQPPECPNGYHYCFPDPSKAAKLTLSTSIGGLTVAGDLGEYVAKAYQWMLGAATTIAIVMLMVAGIRWSLGGLSSEQIGKAKTTIKNATMGLVLLLSTYLILFTVNPQLLKMSVPDFPMIKTVSLVDNASCDDLIKEGYTVEYSGPEVCGTVGTVTEDPEGNATVDGVVCNFAFCANDREMCIPGETPTCMACEELTSDNTVLPPTASICSAFNSLPRYETDISPKTASFTPTVGPNAGKTIEWEETVVQKYEACFLTRDPDGGGDPTGTAACARVVVNCSQVKTCEDYETLPVFSSSGNTTLENIDLGKNSGLPGTDSGAGKVLYDNLGDLTLGSFCGGGGTLNDMCAWNRTEAEKACYLGSFSFGAITDSVASALTTADYNCNTAPDTTSWFYTIFD